MNHLNLEEIGETKVCTKLDRMRVAGNLWGTPTKGRIRPRFIEDLNFLQDKDPLDVIKPLPLEMVLRRRLRFLDCGTEAKVIRQSLIILAPYKINDSLCYSQLTRQAMVYHENNFSLRGVKNKLTSILRFTLKIIKYRSIRFRGILLQT